MKETQGKKFIRDPRIKMAKQLLSETLEEYQSHITDVKPADSSLSVSFNELLERAASLRGNQLFYPYLSTGLGRGSLVELEDGSVKYDFITGIGVHYFGHNHPKMLLAGIDAALEDTVMQGNLQQSAVTIEVLDLLVNAACSKGAKLEHCFLTSSGAMANENAFKMIFQKNVSADRFLAFERCFAGRSMVMAQVTDKPANREGLPKVMDIDYVPFYDPHSPQESTQRAVECLEKHLASHHGRYAGMIFELIQGEGGYYPGNREFFVALMKILKKHHVAVMIDEIQTFGRTPELFAFQYFELDAYIDVVSVGKMTQVCATLFTKEYNPKPGLISQTFTASTSALHAAKAIIRELQGGGYLGKNGKIVQQHQAFVRRLEALSKRYPHLIQGPFGFGAMIAITVADGSAQMAKKFLQALFHNGVMAFVAGQNPARIRFLIPIAAVDENDIDHACKIIEVTLKGIGNE